MTESKTRLPMDVTDMAWLHERSNQPVDLKDPGKWMLFYRNEKMNEKWQLAVDLYRKGVLTGVVNMKCSTAYDNDRSSDSSEGVIILYCNNSTDETTIMNIGRNIINQFGYTDKRNIYYKTDSQTMVGTGGTGVLRNHSYRLPTQIQPHLRGKCLI